MKTTKKLVGVYLPNSLISELKIFIFEKYTKFGIRKTQSEEIETAIKKHIGGKNIDNSE